MNHISDHDPERFHLGMVTDEAELAALEEHYLGCPECAERAEESAQYVDTMRAAIITGNFDLECDGEPRRQNTRTSAQNRSRSERQPPTAIPLALPPARLCETEKAMTFRVLARIGFVNGSDTDVPFNVQANDEIEVRRLVTPEYIMNNVSDDWGVPIANVTVVKAEAVLPR
jgi:hypothetical protein